MATLELDLWNSSTIYCAVAFAFSYLLINAIKNVFFHPLKNIPGPFLAKISHLPSFYHAWKGDRHIWLWQNFQKYGNKIRIYPDGVVYNDPSVYQQIYNHKANVRRANFYKAWQRNKHDISTLSTIDNDVHARKRRILNQVFTEKAVRAAGTFVYKHVDRWHEILVPEETESWSETKDISNLLDYLIFDILGDLCFGKSFEIKEPTPNPLKAVPQNIHRYVKFMYPIIRSPFVDALIWLKPRGLDVVFEALTPRPVKAYFDFVNKSVTERIVAERNRKQHRESGESTRQDMFHFLMQAQDPGTGLPAYSEQELRCEANLLIVAGSHTTSVALSGFFFYITQHPHIYKKLVREIRSTFASAEAIVSGPELSGCEYLRACLLESMRLVPSGPSELPRTILEGGMELDGDFLPKGITIGSSGYCIRRNEDLYRDPNVFRPERYIANEETGITPEMAAAARKGANAFSTGPNSCVGKNLAMLEMLTVIARTLHRMDVRRAPDSHLGEGRQDLGWGRRDRYQFQVRDAYISLRNGPMLQFKRRISGSEPPPVRRGGIARSYSGDSTSSTTSIAREAMSFAVL